MKRIEFSVQYMGNTDFNCVGSINVLLTLGYTRDSTKVKMSNNMEGGVTNIDVTIHLYTDMFTNNSTS